MIDHLGIQVADVEASVAFYLTAFGPLGVREAVRIEHEAGLVVGLAGPPGVPQVWLSSGGGGETREIHLALGAADRSVVDAVHAASVAAAYEVLHAPREWPEYHQGYYAVFLRDLDGHNVEAVTHH